VCQLLWLTLLDLVLLVRDFVYHVVYCNYMYIIWQRYAYWRVGNLSLSRVVVAVHLMACGSMDVAVHLFLHVCSENWTKPSSSKSDVRFKVTVLCFIWSALLIHVSWGCLWPRWVDGYQFLKVQHLRCVPKTSDLSNCVVQHQMSSMLISVQCQLNFDFHVFEDTFVAHALTCHGETWQMST